MKKRGRGGGTTTTSELRSPVESKQPISKLKTPKTAEKTFNVSSALLSSPNTSDSISRIQTASRMFSAEKTKAKIDEKNASRTAMSLASYLSAQIPLASSLSFPDIPLSALIDVENFNRQLTELKSKIDNVTQWKSSIDDKKLNKLVSENEKLVKVVQSQASEIQLLYKRLQADGPIPESSVKASSIYKDALVMVEAEKKKLLSQASEIAVLMSQKESLQKELAGLKESNHSLKMISETVSGLQKVNAMYSLLTGIVLNTGSASSKSANVATKAPSFPAMCASAEGTFHGTSTEKNTSLPVSFTLKLYKEKGVAMHQVEYTPLQGFQPFVSRIPSFLHEEAISFEAADAPGFTSSFIEAFQSNSSVSSAPSENVPPATVPSRRSSPLKSPVPISKPTSTAPSTIASVAKPNPTSSSKKRKRSLIPVSSTGSRASLSLDDEITDFDLVEPMTVTPNFVRARNEMVAMTPYSDVKKRKSTGGGNTRIPRQNYYYMLQKGLESPPNAGHIGAKHFNTPAAPSVAAARNAASHAVASTSSSSSSSSSHAKPPTNQRKNSVAAAASSTPQPLQGRGSSTSTKKK
jgi:hypothetical protein